MRFSESIEIINRTNWLLITRFCCFQFLMNWLNQFTKSFV